MLDGPAGPVAAERLLSAALAAAEMIARRPMAGRVRPDLAPQRYRFWSLTRFSMLLVYDTQTEPIEILRLVHAARDLPDLLKDLEK